MRVIENEALATMKSPVRRLFEVLHRPLINIAPEAESRFDEEFKDFTLQYIDSPEWILSVKDKVIKISTVAVEALWVTGYSHFVIYRDVFQKADVLTGGWVDFRKIKKVAVAADLLGWMFQHKLKGRDFDWPPEFPKPLPNHRTPESDPADEDVADEFCLGGCGCILHHELAHILLRHNEASRVEIEIDADNTSWRWIIPDGTDVSSGDGKKRLMLLVHAYLLLVVRDIHRGNFSSQKHSRSIDRLANILARVDPSPNHVGYSYAFAVLHLHLCNNLCGLTPAPQTRHWESYFEAFNATIEHLSRVPEPQIVPHAR